jgi:hypothetical protein
MASFRIQAGFVDGSGESKKASAMNGLWVPGDPWRIKGSFYYPYGGLRKGR